jgi:hypothetical protein
MKRVDRLDVERAFVELSDEEAVALMEGRRPADDPPGTGEAAHQFAVDLLAASDQRPAPASDGGGSVAQLIVRQPWMRMAAAVAVGVVVGTMARAPTAPVPSASDESVVTTNVVYLEATRSARSEAMPRVAIRDGERWVTLIAYPDSAGTGTLSLQVERAKLQDEGLERLVDPGPDGWEPLIDQTVGAGAHDSVALAVDAALLQPGYYRLRIIAGSESERPHESIFGFVVDRPM